MSKRLTLLKIIYAAYFVSLVVFSIFFIRTGRHQVGGFVTILFALYVLITYLPAYLAFNIATTFVCAKLLRCSYLSYYLPRQYPLLHLIPIADAISAIHVNKIVKNMVVTDPKA